MGSEMRPPYPIFPTQVHAMNIICYMCITYMYILLYVLKTTLGIGSHYHTEEIILHNLITWLSPRTCRLCVSLRVYVGVPEVGQPSTHPPMRIDFKKKDTACEWWEMRTCSNAYYWIGMDHWNSQFTHYYWIHSSLSCTIQSTHMASLNGEETAINKDVQK